MHFEQRGLALGFGDKGADALHAHQQAIGADLKTYIVGPSTRQKRAFGKAENHQAGVQRTQATKGGPGRDFAAGHCDYLFTTFTEIAEAGKHVADIAERAEKSGRQVGVYTVCHVVCRETQAEAEDYYTRYAVTMADHAAVDQHMAGKKEFSQSHDRDAYDRYRQRFAGGAGSYPLIGTPQRIADEMIAIAEQGYVGIALSFVNYTQELPYFCDRVLPLLKKAGLRVE